MTGPAFSLLQGLPDRAGLMRLRCEHPATQVIERWLRQSARDGADDVGMAARPLQFVILLEEHDACALGVIVPSRDATGPALLAGFSVLPLDAARRCLPVLALGSRRFLQQAELALHRTVERGLEATHALVDALSGPDQAQLARLSERCEQIRAGAAPAALLRRLFGRGSRPPQADYEAAVADLRGGLPLVRCPLAADTDACFWLDLAQRVHGRPATAALFQGTQLLISTTTAPIPLSVLGRSSAGSSERRALALARTVEAQSLRASLSGVAEVDAPTLASLVDVVAAVGV